MPKSTTAQEEYPAQIVKALLDRTYRGNERLNLQTPSNRKLIEEALKSIRDILKQRRADLQAILQAIEGDEEEVRARAEFSALTEKEKKTRADYVELAGIKAYLDAMDGEKGEREKLAQRAEMALRIEISQFAENLRVFAIAYAAGPIWTKAEDALREIYDDRPVPTTEILKLPKVNQEAQKLGWSSHFGPSASPLTMCNIIIKALDIALKEGSE